MRKPDRLKIDLDEKNLLGCGLYALALVFKELGVDYGGYDDLRAKAGSVAGEALLGSIYTQGSMDKILNLYKNDSNKFDWYKVEFGGYADFDSKFTCEVKNGYVLLPYYALQGRVWKHPKPEMVHGHWGVFYDVNDGKAYGTQSNFKGEKLGVLDGVDLTDLYESNRCLDKIKVNWGRYNKCKIEVKRKLLSDDIPRCGNICDDRRYCKKAGLEHFECIYNSSIGNVMYILKPIEP